eukprot:3640030-Prymnesium_polylepis.1
MQAPARAVRARAACPCAVPWCSCAACAAHVAPVVPPPFCRWIASRGHASLLAWRRRSTSSSTSCAPSRCS